MGLGHPVAANDHAGAAGSEHKSEDRIMSHTKEAGKRKHLIKAMPILGAAVLSFSLTIGTSAAIGSINSGPATSVQVAGSVMDEEQIFDISLATFRVHDDESAGPQRSAETAI